MDLKPESAQDEAAPGAPPAEASTDILSRPIPDEFQCDPATGDYSWEGVPLLLSAREKSLLGNLLRRPNHMFSKQALWEAVFAGESVQQAAIEVVAHRLRRKIANCGLSVVSLRGVGYMIRVEEPAATA